MPDFAVLVSMTKEEVRKPMKSTTKIFPLQVELIVKYCAGILNGKSTERSMERRVCQTLSQSLKEVTAMFSNIKV